MDALGQTLLQFKPLNKFNITTEDLNNGVYYLKYGSESTESGHTKLSVN